MKRLDFVTRGVQKLTTVHDNKKFQNEAKSNLFIYFKKKFYPLLPVGCCPPLAPCAWGSWPARLDVRETEHPAEPPHHHHHHHTPPDAGGGSSADSKRRIESAPRAASFPRCSCPPGTAYINPLPPRRSPSTHGHLPVAASQPASNRSLSAVGRRSQS